ncbi:hypothetical protein B0H14DRAFT_3758549 [Mycena olivaceomarginata]|nr:hypothetical protein B0H14DRAFT_3758549 [Mycena olivaceomarginata]
MPQETLQLPSFRELTAALRCEEWDPITGVSANDPPAVDGRRAGRAPLLGLQIPSGAFASASTSSKAAKAGTEKRRYDDADADSLLMLGRPYPNSQASSSSSPMSPASTSAHTPSISAPIFPHHSLDQNRLTLPVETPPTPQYPMQQQPQQTHSPTPKICAHEFALGGNRRRTAPVVFLLPTRKIACSRQEQRQARTERGRRSRTMYSSPPPMPLPSRLVARATPHACRPHGVGGGFEPCISCVLVGAESESNSALVSASPMSGGTSGGGV